MPMAMRIKFVASIIALGASILVAAQALGKIAYGSNYSLEGIKFAIAIAMVIAISFLVKTKKYLAFTFILSGLYGMGHIFYDLAHAYFKTQQLTVPVSAHTIQGAISVFCFFIAALLLYMRKNGGN